MKTNTLLTAAVLLLSTSAFAETFGFMVPAGVSLEQARETLFEGASVRISDKRIDDENGVRRFDDPEFHPSVPVLIGERYVLRDEAGGEHLLKIRNVIDGQMFIDLKPMGAADSTRRTAEPGRYQLTTWSVNDAEVPADFPVLELRADGTFRIGDARGKYHQANQALVLDGYYANWGAGALTENGDRIVFEFFRGNAVVKTVLERLPDHGGSSVAAAR